MAGRRGSRARSRTSRRSATGAGLTLIAGALAFPFLAGPAAAADQTVTVRAGEDLGPVAAEIGDELTIVAENVTVADVEVPDVGVLPEVVATTIPSPATVLCLSSGPLTQVISFQYGSVVSPTDVPAEDVLTALRLRPIADATLQVNVAEPPPVEPPPPVQPPPVQPPPVGQPPPPAAPPSLVEPAVIAQPLPEGTQSRLPTGEGESRVAEQSSDLPTALTGTTAGPQRPIGSRSSAASERTESLGGLSEAFRVLTGFDTRSSEVGGSGTGARNNLPMALDVPSLVALMSICVLGAAVLRLQHRPHRAK